MAHKTSKDMGIRIDNASAALTDVKGSVNSQSLEFAITILDDTGMGDTQHSVLAGLAAVPKIPLNGWVNSTTDAIFGPIAQGTSLTKTVEFRVYSGRYYTGEFLLQDYKISGTPDTIEVWSANLVAEGGITRTSVAAA